MPSALRTLSPNWFASVMGTGIVANAAILLPVEVPGRRAFALVVWLLAATWLLVLLFATARHWRTDRELARSHAADPAMAPFYGAPSMALLTVGAGTLLVGRDLIGMHAAVVVDGVLWTAGTLLGLFVAGWVPYLMFTRHDLKLEHAFGGWLMPVVPPMVSAATGAALVGHLPAGQAQLTLLYACYAMFGLALIASLVVIGIVWARLAIHGPGPAKTVPTLWIVLGPLGQSVTAVNLLGAAAATVVPARLTGTLSDFGIVYGVPVFGFALLWLAIAAAVVVRAARQGLPFSLTFWSFTFPVGTCVTGASELSVHTGLAAFTGIAVGLFALLLTAWVTAAVNTARHVATGRLPLPPRRTSNRKPPSSRRRTPQTERQTMSPQDRNRPVESHDPTLSPETNTEVTYELQDIVHGTRAAVPEGMPDAAGTTHATHSPSASTFISLRLGGVLTAPVITISLGVVLITRSASVLVLIPVLLLLLVLTAGIIHVVNRMTAEPEHPSAELAARLEAEGVGDPDRMMTDLVDEFTPPERRNGR